MVKKNEQTFERELFLDEITIFVAVVVVDSFNGLDIWQMLE